MRSDQTQRSIHCVWRFDTESTDRSSALYRIVEKKKFCLDLACGVTTVIAGFIIYVIFGQDVCETFGFGVSLSDREFD